jgi:primosomal protein N' (replication factor Y)
VAEKAARHLHQLMADIPVKKIMLGPEKGLIGKIKDQYIFESVAKLDRTSQAQAQFKHDLQAALEEIQAHKDYKSVRFVVDVDPY